ncbi:MAG: AAA family ATPase [Asticcacaulis sp.]
MPFPITVTAPIESHNGTFNREVVLHSGVTVILGPNGSGKTHFLRGLKRGLQSVTQGKVVKFLSAGRMGLLEQYRSDYDGHRGHSPLFDNAQHGSKNDVTRRHQIETLDGDFQTISERPDILVKIQERLRKLFKRDILVDWDAGSLKIKFARLNETSEPYSSGREASGLLHVVGILASLYDDDVAALLIDEPEVSLHPQLQSFLLKEIQACGGDPANGKKIIVIATHSTEFVQITKPVDLTSLVFCYDLAEAPVQISTDAGELKSKAIQGLIARLGQEHKLALFSRRPLLVEGPSDVMIASTCANNCAIYLEAAGTQLLPVIGKGQMSVVTKLMRLMGKTPIVLADADGLADGLELAAIFLQSNSDADKEASALGASSAMQLARDIFNDFCKFADSSWTEIEHIATKHHYWINGNAENQILAKRRAMFSALFMPDTEIWLSQSNNTACLAMKNRLTALLDLLEQFGCFILRQGSIESYYQSADKLTSIGKPTAAVQEVEWITSADKTSIENAYTDIIRCMRFAASTVEINEAESLRDLLLAILAPAFMKFQSGGNAQSMQLLAKTLVGDRSKLFEITVKDGSMIVDLKTKILDVQGFPLVLRKDDNLFGKVNTLLELHKQ